MLRLNALIVVLCGTLGAVAHAQSTAGGAWPTKTIRIVTPSPAGVGADAFARIYAEHLSRTLGVAVVVENRPGASATLGTDAVAKSAPDGYTLLFSTGLPFTVAPYLLAKIPYRAQVDLAPITTSLQGGSFVLANPNLPIRSFNELISLAKASPGKFTFASYGAGSTAHLGLEMIQDAADVRFLHVPYKQAAMADLMGGHVDVGFEPAVSALPIIQTGKARGLAYTGATRSAAAPDVPTMAESYPGLVLTTWLGFWVPAGTPDAIVAKLHTTLSGINRLPDVVQLIEKAGLAPLSATPAETAATIRREAEAMEKLIRTRNIRIE